MADFNSRYTGAEVEAAVAKSDEIKGYKEVWAGTPTDQGILLSSLPVNPDTGDRTGIYDVIIARESDPIGSDPSVYYFTSRLLIMNEGVRNVGSSHAYAGPVHVSAQSAVYQGAVDNKIVGYQSKYLWSGTQEDLQMFIHKIYRLESV